jgi:hypothetical protein
MILSNHFSFSLIQWSCSHSWGSCQDQRLQVHCTYKNMYRLHHEVQVSTGFTHRGPRLCKSRRDRTEWCNRLVPWATWPWQHIYGLATIASAIKGSSAYLHVATVQTIVVDRVDARHRWIVSRRRVQPNICSTHTINAGRPTHWSLALCIAL